MLTFSKAKKDIGFAVCFIFFPYIYINDYIYCLWILFSCFFFIVRGKPRQGDPPAAPPAAAAAKRSKSTVDLKSYFQFTSLGAMQARLQLVWLTSRVCLHSCVQWHTPVYGCEGAPGKVAATGALCPVSPPPTLQRYSHSSQGAPHLCQTARGVSVSWQTNAFEFKDVFLLVRPPLAGCGWCRFFVLTPCTSHCSFAITVVLHVCVRTVSSIELWKNLAANQILSRNKSRQQLSRGSGWIFVMAASLGSSL